MITPALAATSTGPGVQQHILAAVLSTPNAYGDYAVQVGVTHVLPGAASDDLCHAVPEVVVMVGGELEMWTDGVRATVRTGEHFVIETGAWHRFENRTGSAATMLFAFGGDPVPVTTRRDPQSDVQGA